MAVSVISYAFQGLSTDAKPTARPDGSALDATTAATFAELDTGNLYYWTGISWSLQPPPSALTAIRQAVEAAPNRYELLMLRELRRIVLLLAKGQGVPVTFFEVQPELDGVTVE